MPQQPKKRLTSVPYEEEEDPYSFCETMTQELL